MNKRSDASPRLKPRLRLYCGTDIAFGPGKAELLELIDATGSISAAARKMHMSYRRAWQLVETMNRCFEEPLVVTSKGGSGGGGARLSELGEEVLRLYGLALDQLRESDPLRQLNRRLAHIEPEQH